MATKSIPKQSLSISKKDQAWRRETLDAFIERAQLRIGSNSYKQEMMKLYDYYNGKTHKEDYQYILQPYGGKERKNFPAELRTYPLIKPAVDLLVGEKLKRPFNFTCIVSNPDVVTIKEEAKKEAILENMYQWVVNKLNDKGVDTGIESEEVELPEKVEEIFERNWKDHRAIMAQNAIKYLIPFLKWKEKQQKSFFDWLVSGEVITHRGIRYNEPFYEVFNPLECDWDKDPDIDFIEDGNWFVHRTLASRASIIDKWHSFLTEEQIEQIQNPTKSNRDDFFWHNQENNIFYDEWDEYAEVCTVYWKSLKRIGYRKYVDEFGEELEEVVDEDYEFNPQTDIGIDWDWVNETWQGYRVDGTIYIDIRPHEYQRGSLDNPSKCKLPVNGRRYSERNSQNVSFVLLGIPFQISYDIFKYRLEAAISRSKDILALLDINLIPEGWDMDKFMHIVEATGIAWIDYAKEGVDIAPTHQNILDMSIKTIEQYIALLRYIKEEWEQISGVTRQRMGETSPYELKSTTEQSIIQSSHITEDLFAKFSQVEERDLQALVDYSQIAWVNGKKGMYVAPDGTNQYIDLEEDYALSEYGIFITDAAKENEKLQRIKQLDAVALEQGAPMSMIASMIESDSFIEMKEKIDQVEKMNQEAEEQRQELEQQMIEKEAQNKQAERDHEEHIKRMELNNKIELELIKQSIDNTTDEEWKKELEQRKLDLQDKIESKKLKEEERSNKAKESIERKKVSLTKTNKNK